MPEDVAPCIGPEPLNALAEMGHGDEPKTSITR
jgi:L-fucose mutarotase/ribose pyranase (RbsD/FucU family)